MKPNASRTPNELFVLYRECGEPKYLTKFISQARGSINTGNLEDALVFNTKEEAEDIKQYLSSYWEITSLYAAIQQVERESYKIGLAKR